MMDDANLAGRDRTITAANSSGDHAILLEVVEAVREAGAVSLARYRTDARPGDPEALLTALHENDAAVLEVLRPALTRIRPDAGWVDDELAGGTLPAGEWWVTDPVEGNINHVHGMPDWGLTATLVRDDVPVLTVVHLPLTGDTYTAVRGGGAWQNGVPLRVSAKTELPVALVSTGQARPGESAATHRRIGRSVTAMLDAALVLRVSVPATLLLITVAAGRTDLFWQHSQVRSGLLPGALLVQEAGGVVTDTHGRPWGLTSTDFLASAPGLHAEAVKILIMDDDNPAAPAPAAAADAADAAAAAGDAVADPSLSTIA